MLVVVVGCELAGEGGLSYVNLLHEVCTGLLRWGIFFLGKKFSSAHKKYSNHLGTCVMYA